MREPTDWLIKAKPQQVDRVLLPLHGHVTTPPLIFTETLVWFSRKKRRNILRLPESLDVSFGLPKQRSRCWQKPGPTAQDAEDAKLKRNQAKRSARKDKINWIHDQLTGDLAASSSTVWSTVRNQKRGFRARKTHLVVDSHAAPWSRNHTAFRDHYEKYQWFKAPEADLRNQVLLDRPQIHHTRPEQAYFTLEELQQVIASLKAKKGSRARRSSQRALQTTGPGSGTRAFTNVQSDQKQPDHTAGLA